MSIKLEKSDKSVAHQIHRPQTPSFNHFLLGIWDLYVEMPSVKLRIPFYPDPALFNELRYLWKAIYDLSSPLLFARFAVSAGVALSPAVSLWYASVET
jgi:hypothetical protein